MAEKHWKAVWFVGGRFFSHYSLFSFHSLLEYRLNEWTKPRHFWHVLLCANDLDALRDWIRSCSFRDPSLIRIFACRIRGKMTKFPPQPRYLKDFLQLRKGAEPTEPFVVMVKKIMLVGDPVPLQVGETKGN